MLLFWSSFVWYLLSKHDSDACNKSSHCAQVNGVQFKAFVDSGAQTSIMSEAAADRCNIKRLLDTRFAGIARGVGSAPIVGRVHSVRAPLGFSPPGSCINE